MEINNKLKEGIDGFDKKLRFIILINTCLK